MRMLWPRPAATPHAVAKARGDEAQDRELLNRYRAQATSLGFAGHIQWAESMP
jgi:adenylate cyclase